MFRIVDSGYVDDDGNIIPTVEIYDGFGNKVFSQFPTQTTGNVGHNWAWGLYNRDGHQLVSTDGQTGMGLAYPYFSIPMFPRWNGGTFQTATATGVASADATHAVGMGALWVGRIGWVSHPWMSVDGIWGNVDAGSADGPTYHVDVGSGLATATWQANGGQIAARHDFDITAVYNQHDVPVTIAITNVGTGVAGTNRLACQLMGLFLRNSE